MFGPEKSMWESMMNRQIDKYCILDIQTIIIISILPPANYCTYLFINKSTEMQPIVFKLIYMDLLQMI